MAETANEIQVTKSVDRPDMRSDMRADAPRPAIRSADPRAAADARALEILEHLGSMDQGTDKYAIPENIIPEYWTYEWKRRLTLGKLDPAYEQALAQTGWKDVPAARHPEMMPIGQDQGWIERDGLVLMERPQQITDQIIARDQRLAREQVRHKEAQLSGTPDGHFSRTEDKRTAPNIKKSFERMPVPDDK